MSPLLLDEFCKWVFITRTQKFTFLGYVPLCFIALLRISGEKHERASFDGEPKLKFKAHKCDASVD